MSAATDALKADVTAQTTVIQSAVAMIQGFPTVVAEAVRKALVDAGVGQAETDAAVADADAAVRANTDGLAAALTANTPTP